MAFPRQPNECSDYYVVKDPTGNISGARTNLELANQRTYVASSYDSRPGAYDSGERGYYEQHSGHGGFTSQSRVDRHNDRTFKENNGDFPDRLHGNSAVRTRVSTAQNKPKRKRFWLW